MAYNNVTYRGSIKILDGQNKEVEENDEIRLSNTFEKPDQ